MERHVRFLQGNIVELLRHQQTDDTQTLSKIFEYWSAIQLTVEKNVPFNVWKDINPDVKGKFNLPQNDMGVDLATDDFKTLVQCKFYSETTCINCREFSTFPLFHMQFKNYSDIRMVLTRTPCNLAKI